MVGALVEAQEVALHEEIVVENVVVDFQAPVEVSVGNEWNDKGARVKTKSDLVNVFPSGNPRVSTLLNFGFTNSNPTLPNNIGCGIKRKKGRDLKSYAQSNLDSYLSTGVQRKIVKGKRKLK